MVARDGARRCATAAQRKQQPLRHPFSGNLLPARSRYHPRNAIVYDDIYYGHLLLQTFTHRKLTMLQAPLSEYIKESPRRLETTDGFGFAVRMYHKLKHPVRFDFVRNSTRLRAGLLPSNASRGFCCAPRHGGNLNLKWGPWANLSANYGCCERWVFCLALSVRVRACPPMLTFRVKNPSWKHTHLHETSRGRG